MAVLVSDFILTSGDRFCFSFAFRIISTSLHGIRRSRTAKKKICKFELNRALTLCENKIDWALAVESLLNCRAIVRTIL